MKRLLSLLNIRESEWRTVLYLMAYLTIICFGTSIGIALSTSLLLNQVGATKLPLIFVGISLVSLLVSTFYTQWIPKYGSQGFYRRFLWSSCAFLLLCNLSLRFEVTVAGVNPGIFFQYLAFFVFLGLDIMHFSTYCQDYLNPLQRKRLYPLVLSATKLGGILGGIAIAPLIQQLGAANLLLFWAAAYPVASLVLIKFEAQASPITREKKGRISKTPSLLSRLSQGFSELGTNPFLFWFAVAIFLDIFGGSLMVYQFNEGLVEEFSFLGKPEELSSFLGKFTAVGNGLALILQAFLAPYLIRRFSVPVCHFIYPVISVMILMSCIYSWNLALVAILMFHKDYFFSVLHHPNRSLFYNGMEPEKRSLFVGFFDGVWTYIAHFAVGILLLMLVEWGPHLPFLADGKFATEFSIVGVFLALLSIWVARKLQVQYPKTLLHLVAQKDLGYKISQFRFQKPEAFQLVKGGENPADLAQWLPIMNLQTYSQFFKNLSSEDRLKTLLSKTISQWGEVLEGLHLEHQGELEILPDPNQDQIEDLLRTKFMNPKVLAEFSVPMIIHREKDLLPPLEKCLPGAPLHAQKIIIQLFDVFSHQLNPLTLKTLREKFSQFDTETQKIILNLAAMDTHQGQLPWISSLFESRSRSLRSAALQAVVTLLEGEFNAGELIRIYRSKDWSSEGLKCWHQIFNSQGNRFKEVLKEMRKEQTKLLISHCEKLAVLRINGESESILFQALEEEVNSRVKLMLIFLSDEFEHETLLILEKALRHTSERKYEALELLQSSRDKELSNLLSPFLESGDYLEILERLQPSSLPTPSLNQVYQGCLGGNHAWIRACSLSEIGRKKLLEFRSQVEEYSKERIDITSQEMAVYCLGKLEGQ